MIFLLTTFFFFSFPWFFSLLPCQKELWITSMDEGVLACGKTAPCEPQASVHPVPQRQEEIVTRPFSILPIHTLCGKLNHGPKYVHVLMLETCECYLIGQEGIHRCDYEA